MADKHRSSTAGQVWASRWRRPNGASETANGTILLKKLTNLDAVIQLSRAAMANIEQNLAVILAPKALLLVKWAVDALFGRR